MATTPDTFRSSVTTANPQNTESAVEIPTAKEAATDNTTSGSSPETLSATLRPGLHDSLCSPTSNRLRTPARIHSRPFAVWIWATIRCPLRHRSRVDPLRAGLSMFATFRNVIRLENDPPARQRFISSTWTFLLLAAPIMAVACLLLIPYRYSTRPTCLAQDSSFWLLCVPWSQLELSRYQWWYCEQRIAFATTC